MKQDMRTKPWYMSAERWLDPDRSGYWEECHWYDPIDVGHCSGVQDHDHRPWYMKLYWWTVGPFVSEGWLFGALRGWWG